LKERLEKNTCFENIFFHRSKKKLIVIFSLYWAALSALQYIFPFEILSIYSWPVVAISRPQISNESEIDIRLLHVYLTVTVTVTLHTHCDITGQFASIQIPVSGSGGTSTLVSHPPLLGDLKFATQWLEANTDKLYPTALWVVHMAIVRGEDSVECRFLFCSVLNHSLHLEGT